MTISADSQTDNVTISDSPLTYNGLKTTWRVNTDISGGDTPNRFEGEIADLVVFGDIPNEIDGTFYRIIADPFRPPHPGNVPIDGDGSISAFRFHKGRVDMKARYVQTERYKLERQAGKALFGLYRNPFSHHPCVRAAIDSTANTNVILWADQLLALKEGGLPYAMDPDSLETRGYDPFNGQIQSKTFTAHPKVDPDTNKLVTFGYEAKGLATLDIVTYALDEQGRASDETWVKAPWCGPIHDCGLTKNFLILIFWPFEADVERMKAGGHHWAWNDDLPATFLVIPRRKGSASKWGWKDGEARAYKWKNAMLVHSGGAWEDDDGKISLDTSRVHGNAFPFFPPSNGSPPVPYTKVDIVRWELDLTKPDGADVSDPKVLLDAMAEFPRIDERFFTKPSEWLFLNIIIPGKYHPTGDLIHGFTGLAMLNTTSGEVKYFYAGEDSFCQEPTFIPRTEDAPEGDGWLLSMVERKAAGRCDLVIIDTKNFEKAIAVVQLPFRVRAQVHGNWVPAAALKSNKSLVAEVKAEKISGKGALEPLIIT